MSEVSDIDTVMPRFNPDLADQSAEAEHRTIRDAEREPYSRRAVETTTPAYLTERRAIATGRAFVTTSIRDVADRIGSVRRILDASYALPPGMPSVSLSCQYLEDADGWYEDAEHALRTWASERGLGVHEVTHEFHGGALCRVLNVRRDGVYTIASLMFPTVQP